MKSFILIILLFSCGQKNKIDQHDRNETVMSKFKLIDKKLKDLAEKLNAKVAKDGSGYYVDGVPVSKPKIEERRIIWIEGQIGKAILIHPDFTATDINSPTWNFFNLAWLEQGSPSEKGKPFWTKYLLKNAGFEEIEKNIDQLLSTSVENLATIKREDLK